MSNYIVVPDGEYYVRGYKTGLLEKENGKLFFGFTFSITEGVGKKEEAFLKSWNKKWPPCITFGRTMTKTKNEAAVKAETITFLEQLDSGEDVHYNKATELQEIGRRVLAAISDTVEYKIRFTGGAFPKIEILEIYDME